MCRRAESLGEPCSRISMPCNDQRSASVPVQPMDQSACIIITVLISSTVLEKSPTCDAIPLCTTGKGEEGVNAPFYTESHARTVSSVNRKGLIAL